MNKKNFVTAGVVVVSGLIVTAAGGCSDDSTGSTSSGFSCPAVGSKNCPNDEATTQAAADLCKKCETELKAVATCQGSSKATCGADGKSQAGSTDTTKCKTENDAATKCFTAALTGDAGG